MAEKKINGATYRHNARKAEDAIMLQYSILRFLGLSLEELAEVAEKAAKGGDKVDIDLKQLAAYVQGTLNKNTPDVFMPLVKSILEGGDAGENLEVQGENGSWVKFNINGQLTGNMGALVPLLVFVLGEEFGELFTGLPDFKKFGGMVNRQ